MFQITFNIEHNRDQGASTMDDNLSIIEEELEQLEVNTSGEKQSDDESDSDVIDVNDA